MSNTTNPYQQAIDDAKAQIHGTDDNQPILSAQNEPAPLHYSFDRNDVPLIFATPRGEDGVVDQYRDKVEAAHTTVTAVQAQVAAINADPDLSAEGKAKRTSKLYRDALALLGPLAKDLNKQEGQVRGELLEPLPFVESYATGDTVTPQHDLLLLQMYRSATPDERTRLMTAAISGQEPRLAEALLRAPPILTGMAATTLANMRDMARSRLHPEKIERRAKLEHASHAARTMLDRARNKLATAGQVPLSEQRALLGDAAGLFTDLL